MAVLAFVKGLSWGGKALGLIAPVAVIGGLWLAHAGAVNAGYERGAMSRDDEVDKLKSSITALEGNLSQCGADKSKLEADVIKAGTEVKSLNSKLVAQGDEHAKALKAQAAIFASANKATQDAMRAMAQSQKGRDEYYAGLNKQLQNGVSYEADKNGGGCVIIGGGRVLRGAAKGHPGPGQ